jgi:hypothetical protein
MATVILIVTAIIFLGMALGILYQLRASQKKVAVVQATPTSSAGKASSMSPGEMVEIIGTLRCPTPVTSQLTGEPCAFFKSELIREYEADEPGPNDRTRRVKRKETVASRSERASFSVQDAMGSVLVNPDGAEIDGLEVVNRFDQDTGKASIFGSLVVDLGPLTISGQRTLGYRHVEQVLKLDKPVYVLGVVCEGGSIGAARADHQDMPFIISHRSEADLTAHLQREQRSLRIWCGLCVAVGVVLVIAAFIVR